jgi:hypothetical protein
MGVNSCGTTMLDQGAFVGLASIDWDTTPKTANFTAVSGNGYFVNTTSSAITLTLPAGSAGDIIAVSDYASTFNVPATPAVYSNPESSLGTPDLTVTGVNNFNGLSTTIRGQDLYSAVDVGNFDSSDYGVLWELGGTVRGFAASLEAGGQLWVAAYISSSWQATNQAYLKVDVSSYYNTPGTFYTTIDQSAKQFNLYFQPGGPTSGNQAISLGTSTAGDGDWAGSAAGALGQVNSDMVNFGFTNYNQPFTGDLQELRWYYNTAEPSPFQSITTPAVSATPLTISPNGTDKINGTNDDVVISTKGICFTLIYVDSTQGWKSIESNSVNPTGGTFITATGGTITTCGDYKIHTFTGPGTFTVTCVSSPSGSVDYLVVGGGGGAGARWHSGGGGAGGYRESSGAASGCYTASPLGACVSALPVSAQGYPITVGAGGSGGASGGNNNGTDGNTSIFSTITAALGGRGGAYNTTGGSGGSGGGGGSGNNPNPFGGTGNTPPVSPPQGNNGGNGETPSGGGGGGGGGGAGGIGSNFSSPNNGGNGGAGVSTSISGSSTGFAGGSAGTGCAGGGNVPSPAWGSKASNPAGAGENARANSGSGGGTTDQDSSPNAGGNGGSGIVIIRYRYQ